jgi:hypothetical protein
MAVRDQDLVQLLDAWPELGDLLTPAERAAARQALVLRSQRALKGQWSPGAQADPVTCLLVLDGLLIRVPSSATCMRRSCLAPVTLSTCVMSRRGWHAVCVAQVARRGEPRRAT